MVVPEGRIFLINSMGELHNINHTYRQTYLSLSRHVDLTFPPLPHDGADDAFDGHDVDDYDDDGDGDDDDADADELIGRESHHHRGLIRGSGSHKSDSGSKSGSFSGLTPLEPMSMSSSSLVAPGGGGGGSGSGGADSVNGGGGVATLAGVAGAASAAGDIRETAGKVPALGDDSGSGSGSGGGGSTTHPAMVKTDPIAAAAAAAKTAAKATASIPRRWAEVAPRREKSFYPNRAAVEDRFTDLNFWREPPPLIGDDDDDEDDDDDDDGDDDDDDGNSGDGDREEEENGGNHDKTGEAGRGAAVLAGFGGAPKGTG